ncbi:MAG TPA: Ig-like domain-containing protein [Gammaproteobacteria bacterium]
MRNRVLPAVFALSAFVLAGCGGGSGGDTASPPDPAPAENVPPTAKIVFPPADAIFTAETITVRGTATDTDGTVNSVRVNGIEAGSSDGFATWTAKIDVAMGSNTITVDVDDDDGDTRAAAAIANLIRTTAPFTYSEDIAVDTVEGRALVLDRLQRTLFAVDFQDGTRSIISGQGRGTGPIPEYAVAFALNETGTEAYVAERVRVLAYDLETGDRREIFSTDRDDIYIADIAYDAAADRLLAVGYNWEMRVIDPVTVKMSCFRMRRKIAWRY